MTTLTTGAIEDEYFLKKSDNVISASFITELGTMAFLPVTERIRLLIV